MKKAFILCVLLTLFFSFSLAFAEIAEAGDYQYSIREDGTVEITKFTGGADKLTIPSTLDGHLVTSIGNDAFYNCVDLTSLKHIPAPEERILDCQHEWIYRLLEDETAEVLGYCGPSESLMIPDELDGHPTTSFAIQYPYIHDDDRVKNIYLPSSIRKINYSCLNAFFKDGVEIRMEQDSFAYRWCQATGMIN